MLPRPETGATAEMKKIQLHLSCLPALVIIVALALAACGGDSQPSAGPAQAEEAQVASAAAETDADEEALPHPIPDPPFEDIKRASFLTPTQIDNEWMGMQPGMQRVYEGTTVEDGEELPHRIEFTVTDLVKVIDGVSTVVALIHDVSDGELIEAEIAFYAQAADRTVWYFGEYPEVYENGEFIEADAWLAGQEDAVAGIAMEANPRKGTGDYAQGWAPENEWTDRARVLLTGEQRCVVAGCYDDVLVVDEWAAEEPGFKLKSYARGVGNIAVGFRGDVEAEETLELIEVNELDAAQLADIRAQALKLDQRAYDEAEQIWAETKPALRASVAGLDETAGAHPIPNPPFEDASASTFKASTDISNEWVALRPGMQRVYEGVTVEAGVTRPHRIKFTVTDVTKEVDGVDTLVALIQDISAGKLVEAEISFYAQADDGAVWYFGEYPEVYENGRLVEVGAWLSGEQDARAGLVMEADPGQGDADHTQGWAPRIVWTDRWQVHLTGQQTCVAAGCYEDVLVIDEWNSREPGYKLKSYARGAGNVEVGFRGDVLSEERLELVESNELTPDELAVARAEALRLDTRAYAATPEIWAGSEPAQQS